MKKLFAVAGEGHGAPVGAPLAVVEREKGVDIDDLLEMLAELRTARRLLGPGS